MKLTAKRLSKVALKLGYQIREGKKHTLIYHPNGNLISTIPRGVVKSGTLSAILKQLGITDDRLRDLL